MTQKEVLNFKPKRWSEVDMRAALTKESLSIAADNYSESLSMIRRWVREGLKLERAAA